MISTFLFFEKRRSDRLRGPRVLRRSGVFKESVVPHGAGADRDLVEEAAAGRYRLILRAHEIHHRGKRTSELRLQTRIQ